MRGFKPLQRRTKAEWYRSISSRRHRIDGYDRFCDVCSFVLISRTNVKRDRRTIKCDLGNRINQFGASSIGRQIILNG